MERERPTNANGLALGLAILNGFGALTAFVVAAIFVSTASQVQLEPRGDTLALPMLTLGWVSGVVGLILLVGLAQAVQRYNTSSLPPRQSAGNLRLATLVLALVWPAALLGGNVLAQQSSQLNLFLLPPCLMLSVALPVWWLFTFASRGLKTPPHRAWGTASVVLTAALPLVMLIELFFIVIGVIALTGVISNQPQLTENLAQITRDLSRGLLDANRLSALLEPFLRNPGVVFLVISGLSVVVPLIEETFKPLGLWFLAKRGFSPAQGFVLGAASGAAFALVESLATLSAVSGGDWLALVLGRAGTALLHITCSGLVGWGLGLAWTRAKYGQLAGLFLLAVAVHGAWNGFAQFLGLLPFISDSPLSLPQNGPGEVVITIVLGILLIASFLMLFYINRRLNAEQAQEEAAALVVESDDPVTTPPEVTEQPLPPAQP